MLFTIYCITNMVTGKRYVGQTRQDPKFRWVQHISEARRGRDSTYFHRAILKYGCESFNLSLLERELLTLEAANEAEQKWIQYFKSNVRRFGYNLEAGGAQKNPSHETRLKQSASQKKRFAIPGARERLSACTRGRTLSDEHRATLRRVRLGNTNARGGKNRTLSEEHRTKIAVSHTGRTTFPQGWRVQQIDSSGKILAEFSSLNAAARAIAGPCAQTILRCAHGRIPTAGGFMWKLV